MPRISISYNSENNTADGKNFLMGNIVVPLNRNTIKYIRLKGTSVAKLKYRNCSHAKMFV
jgi:hypothetical protein